MLMNLLQIMARDELDENMLIRVGRKDGKK